MSKIRVANEGDLAHLTRMAKSFLEESGQPYEFDRAKTKQSFDDALMRNDMLVLLSVEEGKPNGFLVGHVASPLFSHDVAAIEVAWWVRPSHRGQPSNLKMIKQYETWARDNGAKVIGLTYLPDIQNLTTLYGRMGYHRSESNFIKET